MIHTCKMKQPREISLAQINKGILNLLDTIQTFLPKYIIGWFLFLLLTSTFLMNLMLVTKQIDLCIYININFGGLLIALPAFLSFAVPLILSKDYGKAIVYLTCCGYVCITLVDLAKGQSTLFQLKLCLVHCLLQTRCFKPLPKVFVFLSLIQYFCLC